MNQFKSNNIKIKILHRSDQGEKEIEIEAFPYEKLSNSISKYKALPNNKDDDLKFIFNARALNLDLTLAEAGLENNSIIHVIKPKQIRKSGPWLIKDINIKFIKISKNNNYKNNNQEIIGALKLCLLKEVSQKIPYERLAKLPNLIYYIMEILSNGVIIGHPIIKKDIEDVLEKMRGSSIISFSNYVDEIIDSNQLNKIINLLGKDDLKEMNDLKNLLSKYNNCIKLFNQEFEKSKKESIFEFSVISLIIIEREDFEIFEREREKCPNRVERILYHGTNIEPISGILTSVYRNSLENKKAINGKGVYFTDLQDYAWHYEGKDGIPKVNDTFNVIVNFIYYDKNGFEKVKDDSRSPGKNQINFSYSGAHSEILINPDKSKFLATEYVINDLDQICPFMSVKLKRVEFCVIWRDNNFSSKPVYNNEYDEKFKVFLKERIKYINQVAQYNIYPCETTEEALELVKRKKYNKIILISNVGADFGGKIFIDKARKIIGSDVIALFLAYRICHLDWIKNYKNALFSNEPKFYEEYLQCFEDKYQIEYNIQSLIEKMEKHYEVRFNFDDKYLYFPHFKEDGKYNDLQFQINKKYKKLA